MENFDEIFFTGFIPVNEGVDERDFVSSNDKVVSGSVTRFGLP